MKLLLFDIDGTILHTHGVGRRSVEAALADVFGRPVSTEGISFSGKTDPQILMEVMDHAGIEHENGTLERTMEAYVETMRRAFEPERVTLLPGVSELIAHLSTRDDVALGLLTGNLEPMAYLKLEAVGLDGFFDVGAFGSDSAHRPDLPAIAVDRVHDHTGRRFGGKDVVIIGDTEHDIACGRGIGAFSVAVCTGHFSRNDLAPHDPDLLLDDLADHDTFLREVVV